MKITIMQSFIMFPLFSSAPVHY